MDWKQYIESDDKILVGKPIIKGTRLSVEHIIKLFASGWTELEILENYPTLTKINLQAVFSYIQYIIKDVVFYHYTIQSKLSFNVK